LSEEAAVQTTTEKVVNSVILPKSQADTAVQVVREIAEGREGRAELMERAVPDAREETLAEGLMVVTAEGGTYAIPTEVA